jgi:dTDP-4-amino-4,6-dideoxygalactose transaminase
MLSLFKVFMSEDILEPMNKLLMSGQLTQGPVVEKFETKLKEYLNNPYILTLNSATAGLTIALRLLKNKDTLHDWPGFNDLTDIVLTPALTCFATTAAVLANNVKIKWLDVDLNTANICLEDLKNKLNEKTKVIYLVHWGGNPVDLDELDKICEEHKENYGFKPIVVEDCAHSFGAEYNGKKIGSNKNICVFSLQAIKHLTTGDGGLITLPTEDLYERCKLLRWYGINREKRNYKGKDFRLENDILEYGYKFHMNDINATIGVYNLPHIPELLRKNRENGKYFDEHLKDISGIKLMKNNPKCNSAYWLYTIRVLDGKKQDFMDKMKEKNIMTSQVHNRNDINSCVKEFEEALPNLDILEKELVCIPVGWWLTHSEIEYIINIVCELFSEKTLDLDNAPLP